MAAMRRREAALALLGIAAAVLVTSCASGPAPLHQDQIDAVMDAYDPEDLGSLTVGEAVSLAPEGTIGMIDVRSSSGTHDVHVSVDGMPGEEFADWPVVSVCGSAGVVPSVLLVALPPHELAGFAEHPWRSECDFTVFDER
ncbi:hypothetical protein [Agrococcus sp. Ld7]|uniref:hypothetical protein n=1 Tax=Agrococcus sp. Ld7 TaxID=649148 RepID=UPI003867270B